MPEIHCDYFRVHCVLDDVLSQPHSKHVTQRLASAAENVVRLYQQKFD